MCPTCVKSSIANIGPLPLLLPLVIIFFKKAKAKSSTCYSASYVNQTQDQKRFTISGRQVAADWHKLMIPQHTMRSSACISEQLDPWCAASRHTTTPINHTRPSPCKLLLLISHTTKGKAGEWGLQIFWNPLNIKSSFGKDLVPQFLYHMLQCTHTRRDKTAADPIRPYALPYFGSSSRAFIQSSMDRWGSPILPYAAALHCNKKHQL